MVTEPSLWVIRLPPTPHYRQPSPHLYGSMTITHLEENFSMVNLPYLCKKIQGKTRMAEEPSHVKQLSLIHVCKIGLKVVAVMGCNWHQMANLILLTKYIVPNTRIENPHIKVPQVELESWISVCLSCKNYQLPIAKIGLQVAVSLILHKMQRKSGSSTVLYTV